MDLATTIGFFGGILAVVGTMLTGGHIAPFVSMHGFIIVFVGGFFAVMYTAPMPVFLGSFKAMGTAFKKHDYEIGPLAKTLSELSAVARKDGLMALEGRQMPHKFVQSGLQMLIDGSDEHKMAEQLTQDIAAMKGRHTARQDVVKAWVELGPAYGMIGTLIGLVEMMGNMSDPTLVGKGMATALVGTMYGAIAANVFFGPMATKLKNNTNREVAYCEAAIEGLRSLSRSEAPRMIIYKLAVRLPPDQREELLAAA
ncbi:flagellar motor protein MotA [Gemmobacter lanyuensis]|uniref:Flagellar motor protein MotA n=1 Tax=Gemmobacter lanyuensis TaxID=1054497 RepID=A0A918MI08_9RHOB|nr:MotA/TolQ/ExbB proton channel family protein [Gemmobacter lanyuensis]GGW23892.1 flagellar motor protein MotA [Gemmobacter lanyuensis]